MKKQILGTGLGLFIARKIAEAHGGTVWAESAGVNQGSAFHMKVPVMKSRLDISKGLAILGCMEAAVVNHVYDVRMESHMTQEDLAAKVGVSRQTIIAIEKGNYVPSVLLALKISRFFKKPLDKIFYLSL